MIAAALAALPLVQKAEEGVGNAIAHGVSGLFSLGHAAKGGQNLPGGAGAGSAESAQSSAPAQSPRLSSGLLGALLSLQEASARG